MAEEQDHLESAPAPRRAVFGWVFYDLANTVYSMNVVTLYFSQWLIIDLCQRDIVYSAAFASSIALIGLTMPAIGAISDARRNKIPLLFIFTLICCLAVVLIGVVASLASSGTILLLGVIGLFIVANYGYNGGLAIYNALLPSVSTSKNMGRISGWGTALGYVGSLAGMALVLPFVHHGGRSAAFIPTAIIFMFLSIPTFLWVRERKLPLPQTTATTIASAYRKVWDTLVAVRRYPGLLRFLVAKTFYEDGIATAILFMAVYAERVMGFPDEVKVPFFMVTTTFAVIGSAVAGFLVDRIGPKRTLLIDIAGWVVTLILIALVANEALFWVLGCVVGILLGTTWTAARPLLVQLTPPQMAGEAFGLYSLSGKVASVIGPLLWGLVVLIAEPLGVVRYRLGVASLAVLMFVGFILLLRVPSGGSSQLKHKREDA